MRKIATIENEITRAETRIAKANEAIAKAETRLANAVAKCKKAGYEYKGDGKDADRAYDMFHNWDIAWGPVRTADQARESIERNKSAILGSNYDLELLRKELAQANDKINSIPQAIKDYEPKLADSFIKDSKFRRDMTIKEIAERKKWSELFDMFRDRRKKLRQERHGAVAALHRLQMAYAHSQYAYYAMEVELCKHDGTDPAKAMENLRRWTRIRNGLAYKELLRQKGTPKKEKKHYEK